MDDQQQPSLEQSLDTCLDAIARLGWSVDECVAQYPAYGDRLKPLLNAAQKLGPARLIEPSTAFRQQAVTRLRARLLPANPRPEPRAARGAFISVSRAFAGVLATVLVVAALAAMVTVLGNAPKAEPVQPATADSGSSVTPTAAYQPTAATEPVAATVEKDPLEAEIDQAMNELDDLNAAADTLNDEP